MSLWDRVGRRASGSNVVRESIRTYGPLMSDAVAVSLSAAARLEPAQRTETIARIASPVMSGRSCSGCNNSNAVIVKVSECTWLTGCRHRLTAISDEITLSVVRRPQPLGQPPASCRHGALISPGTEHGVYRRGACLLRQIPVDRQ